MTQVLFSGAVNGATYGVLGAAIALTFVVSRMINLSIGEIVMVGAVWSGWLQRVKGWSTWTAITAAVAGGIGLMVLVERLLLERQFRAKASPLALALLALAVALAIQGVTYGVIGVDVYSAPRLLEGSAVDLFGARIGRHKALLGVLGVAIALALAVWLRRTISGRKVIAAGDDPEGCDVVGMHVSRVRLLVFALAGAAAVIFGALSGDGLAMTYTSGLLLTVKGVLTASISGLKYADRAIVAGVGLGMAEALVARYVSSDFMVPIVFGVLIVMLFLRRDLVQGADAV